MEDGKLRTCDHQIALSTRQHIIVQQPLSFGLCESRLEVAVKTILYVFL